MHAVRNGKDRMWIYIILFLPLLGGLAYFFSEILPSLRSGKLMQNSNIHTVENALFPTRRIQALEQQISLADTYQNRILLAEAYAAATRYEDAISLFTKTLRGIYKDDSFALSKRALTYYASGNLDLAKRDFEHILQTGGDLNEKDQLIYAIVLENLNQTTAAENAYQKAINLATGLEAEYQYALFLKRSGKSSQAKEVFEYMVVKAKSSPSYFRRLEAKWLRLAKEELQGKTV